MADRIKHCGSGQTENLEHQPFQLHCSCNPYDFDYPPDHPPPPAPPNGRDDLWDLQFCRWWGWNWVRKREATIVARYEEPYRNPKQFPPKQNNSNSNRPKEHCGVKSSFESHVSKSCAPQKPQNCNNHSTKCGSQQNQIGRTSKVSATPLPPQQTNIGLSKYFSPPAATQPPPPVNQLSAQGFGSEAPQYDTESIKSHQSCGSKKKPPLLKEDCHARSGLPTKKQFKEMCKCLLGKRQKLGCCKMAAMANLYKTPSGSTCTMEKLAYGLTDRSVLDWPKCTQKKKSKLDRSCDVKCQLEKSKFVEPEEEYEELQTSLSKEGNVVASQKHYERTEASFDYLPFNLPQTRSDTGCCSDYQQSRSIPPTLEQFQKQNKHADKLDIQTQTMTCKDSKETQTKQAYNEEAKKIAESWGTKEVRNSNRSYGKEVRNTQAPCGPRVKTSRELCCNKEVRNLNAPSGNKEARSSQAYGAPKEVKNSPESYGIKEVKNAQVSCSPKDVRNSQTSGGPKEVKNLPRSSESKEVKKTQGQCATNGPCKSECKTYAEQMYKVNSSKHKTICIRVCCCTNCKPIISTDASDTNDSQSDLKNSPSKESRKGNSIKHCNTGFSSNKDFPVTYPIIMPPSTMKMLSKFGTPSKNYPWMHDIGSDATTTTLNNWESYKSPASGKTYEFNTVMEFDSRDSFTLPDLIDISEDLSYLKKIENTSNRSENESRLLLDAVCDAILHEHEEKSLNFLDDFQAGSWQEALQRDYTHLETLCDLTREFGSKSEVHTELSRSYFTTNEDVGINTASIIKNDPDDMKRMIKSIMDNMLDINHKVSSESNSEPFSLNVASRKNCHPYEYKGDDDDVYTKTGLLVSKRNDFHKKNIKREAPNSVKNENNSKKVKHEEKGKIKNRDNIQNAQQENERIGTIFTKIEDIVKQSKVKSAEIQDILGYLPQKHERNHEFGEDVLETDDFDPNCSTNDKASELDVSSSKRIYKMSSDAFIGRISPFIPKNTEHKNMKCYDIFCDKIDNDPNENPKSCSGIASQIILEEENSNSSEDINKSETKDENAENRSLEKVSNLSIQSFVVCDEKSTVNQNPCTSGVKKEKIFKKKKIVSKVSLIPIRKQGSDENIGNPL